MVEFSCCILDFVDILYKIRNPIICNAGDACICMNNNAMVPCISAILTFSSHQFASLLSNIFNFRPLALNILNSFWEWAGYACNQEPSWSLLNILHMQHLNTHCSFTVFPLLAVISSCNNASAPSAHETLLQTSTSFFQDVSL